MKTIRCSEDLRKHIETLRIEGETDAALALRLDIHVNTMTKLKHSSAMFEASAGMAALGLKPVYEAAK